MKIFKNENYASLLFKKRTKRNNWPKKQFKMINMENNEFIIKN